MGKFTGKSDFYDWCEMHNTPSKVVENSKIYLNGGRLLIKEERDLIPYYTHLMISMASSKDEGATINLSSKSYIDIEEEKIVAALIRDAIYIARKAKKEKKEFTFDYYMSCDSFPWHKECTETIIDIINKNPEIIKYHLPKNVNQMERFFTSWIIPEYFSSVHTAMHNRMRKEFLEFASSYGYKTSYDGEGENNPIIWDMLWNINEFEKSQK